MNVELNGAAAGELSRINAGGTATFDGALNVTQNFTPSIGDQFSIVTYTSFVGSFSSTTGLEIGPGSTLDLRYNPADLRLVLSDNNSLRITDTTPLDGFINILPVGATLTLTEAVQGVEFYYNLQVTPWFHLTGDLQVVENGIETDDTAIILGLRGKLDL